MEAREIVQTMYDNDAFSQWMGIEIIDVGIGHCAITMVVRNDMTNGFGITHGGVTFSLADSAFAFASNSHGRHAVSIETSISHIKAVNVGDLLLAEATMKSRSQRLGIYEVTITNQEKQLVALFKGTVFIKDKEWATTQQ